MAWVRLEDTLAGVDRRLQAAAGDVPSWWRGLAADSLLRTWAGYAASLPKLREQVGELVGVLRIASRAIQSAQDDYDHTVEILGALTLATGAAAFFTFGFSELGEAAALEGAAATVEDLLATLGQTLARTASILAEALSTMGRMAGELALTLSVGGGGPAFALAGGGSVGLGGVSLTGGQVPTGVVAAAGGVLALATADALLAKGFEPGDRGGSGGAGAEVRYPDDQVPREYSATTKSIDHFSKHADPFRFPNRTPDQVTSGAIDDFLRNWIMNPEHRQIVGTYRRERAIFYVEEGTNRVIILHPDGRLWTGFQLGERQMESLLNTGGFG